MTVQTAPRYTFCRFDTIPACGRQTDRRTDGQTDGIAVASTALAMRALWRAVKMTGRKQCLWRHLKCFPENQVLRAEYRKICAECKLAIRQFELYKEHTVSRESTCQTATRSVQ